MSTPAVPSSNSSAVASSGASTPSASASAPTAPLPQSVLARRQFPAIVFILMHSSDSLPSIRGVYMSLSNANQECRRLRALDLPLIDETPDQAEKRVAAERKRDMARQLERWKNAEGVECWVEVHEVTPRKWMDRGSVSSVTHPPKLYQNEEMDDEIEEDDEYHGGGLCAH